MGYRYRVVCFGRPRGPWRSDRRMAQRDAIALGLGCYDEHTGQYYHVVPGEIECERAEAIRISA